MKNGNFDDINKIYVKKVPIEMKDCWRYFGWIMLVITDAFLFMEYESILSWIYYL